MLVLPVFAYGTLLPDQPNYHLWAEDIVEMDEVVFPNGHIYDLGYCPMLVEGTGGFVKGGLFTLKRTSYELVLQCLDELEGYDPETPDATGYRRLTRKVKLESGRLARAWVYIGHKKHVASAQPIASGDWVSHVSTKKERVATWWQSVRTVSGLYGAGT